MAGRTTVSWKTQDTSRYTLPPRLMQLSDRWALIHVQRSLSQMLITAISCQSLHWRVCDITHCIHASDCHDIFHLSYSYRVRPPDVSQHHCISAEQMSHVMFIDIFHKRLPYLHQYLGLFNANPDSNHNANRILTLLRSRPIPLWIRHSARL